MDEKQIAAFKDTRADLIRAGLVIALVGVVFGGLGYRFSLGEDATDFNAAVMIWVIGTFLLGIGIVIMATSSRFGVPEPPPDP
jgi:hypothetical protein